MASGDPFPNSVIIWTRCAPIVDDVNDNTTVSAYVPLYNPVPIYNESEITPPSTAPVCVKYNVASDNAFAKVVDSGMAYTSSDVDYTLKVFHFCPILRNARTHRIRLKPRISVRTHATTTSSVSATPMSPAQLDVQRRHLHPVRHFSGFSLPFRSCVLYRETYRRSMLPTLSPRQLLLLKFVPRNENVDSEKC